MSDTAKRVLKNRPDLHKKFDKIFDNETDVTMAFDSRVSEALRILREDMGPKSIPGKKYSTGGPVNMHNYYKDIL